MKKYTLEDFAAFEKINGRTICPTGDYTDIMEFPVRCSFGVVCSFGKSEQFIRVSLQTGTAPFGFASKHKTKWSYHISPKKLDEYISA